MLEKVELTHHPIPSHPIPSSHQGTREEMTGTCGGIFFCAKPTLIMGDVWIMGVYQPKIGAPVGPRVSTSYQKCPTDVFGWQP